MSELQNGFDRVLQAEADRAAWILATRTIEQMGKRGIGITGQLRDEIHARATRAVEGHVEVLMNFGDEGRFRDMSAMRGYHKGQYVGRDARTELHRRRKPEPFYSKSKWGVISSLVERLSLGILEETITGMKHGIEHGQDTH